MIRQLFITTATLFVIGKATAQNLLSNGGFEQFTAGTNSYMTTGNGNPTGLPNTWQLAFSGNNFPTCSGNSCGTTSIVTNDVNSGANALQLTITKHTNRNDIRLFQSFVNNASSNSFVIKFFAKTDVANTPITVNVFKSTEAINSNGSCTEAAPCQSFNLSTSWRQYRVYVDLSNWTTQEKNNMRISIRPNTTTAVPSGPYPKSFWFDDVVFEVVNPATELKEMAIEVANERRILAANAGFTAEANAIASSINSMVNATIALPTIPTKGVGFNPVPKHTTESSNPYIIEMHKWGANYLNQSFSTYPKTNTASIFARNFDGRSLGYVLENLQWLLLSPLSKYQYNPELFRRFLTIIYATSDDYVVYGGMDNDGTPGSNLHPLNDWFAAPLIAYGWGISDRCFQNYIPPVLLDKIRNAADTMGVRHYNLGLQIDDYLYTNRDISYAEILTNIGFHRNNTTWINLAKRIIDSTYLVSLFPDGAYAYRKKQNEVTNYHGATNNTLAKIWSLIEYQPAWECVKKSPMFEVLSVEPNEVPEFYTAPAWKTMFNGSTGTSAEPLVTISRNPFTKTKLNEARLVFGYTDEMPLSISFYDASIPTQPLPNNYVVYDRNIQGPRARYGKFSYAGVGRNSADANSTDLGLQTVVGAMITQPNASEPNKTDMNAALMAVHSKVHIRRGSPQTEWQDWAYMMSSVSSYTCVTKNASSISAVGGLQRQGPGPVAFESNWTSYQHWITLPDRLIGIVETYPKNNASAQAFAVDGRVRFTFGRGFVQLPKYMVTEVPNQRYAYGAFKAIVHQHDFDNILVDTAGIVRDDFRNSMEIIFRHNQSNGTTLFTYPSSTRKFFIVEVRDSTAVGNATVTRVTNGNVRGLIVQLNGKSYASYRNDGTTAANINLSAAMLTGNTHQLHFSRKDSLINLPILITNPTYSLAANQQVLLVSTNTPLTDTGRGWQNMAHLLTENANIVLPVTLSKFSARKENCKVLLQWTSTSEVNFSKYEIEKSIDGKNFVTIESINGKNSGASINSYATRLEQTNDKAYYRLKMIDKDGKISYSNTLPVTLPCKPVTGILQVFPNPTQGSTNINVQYTSSIIEQNSYLRLYDINGKELQNQKVSIANGNNQFIIPSFKLSPGTYIVQLILASGTVKEARVIIS